MRGLIDLMETIWPQWQSWLFNHPDARSLLDDPEPLFRMIPREKLPAAHQAISGLKEWLNGPHKVYRVIGIADWQNQFGGDSLKAAAAWAGRLQSDPSQELGCYWARHYSGDPHTMTGGASMGHDVDSEGFPVVLSGTVDSSEVVWGATIAANIAYPHEEEITIQGTVHMRYVAVDDQYTDFSGDRHTGPYIS